MCHIYQCPFFYRLNGVRNMSENMKVSEKLKKDMQYCLRSIPPKNGAVKQYEKLALKLSKLVGKTPAWGWRYVQSVHHGTVEPSKRFLLAMELYRKPPKVKPIPLTPEWWDALRKKATTVMVRHTNKAVIKDWRVMTKAELKREAEEIQSVVEWIP